MAKRKARNEKVGDELPIGVLEAVPLWQLDIVELTGHNLEARGREEVNLLLKAGWRLPNRILTQATSWNSLIEDLHQPVFPLQV